MKLQNLKRIIKESVLELRNEQVLPGGPVPGGPTNPGGSCHLPAGNVVNGPYPNQFDPAVWVDKWETFKDNGNLGCQWVKGKYLGWNDKLSVLHSKPFPKCNKRWQSMLQFKVKHVQTMHAQCI